MDHQQELTDFVQATAQKYGIPGVAVGVWADGWERYAYDGVTSIDNPLPIDRDTLFVLGSVTKTYTAPSISPMTPLSTGPPTIRASSLWRIVRSSGLPAGPVDPEEARCRFWTQPSSSLWLPPSVGFLRPGTTSMNS